MTDLEPESVDEQNAEGPQSLSKYDETSEARVRRKLDRHLMPLFFVLCE